MYPPEKDDWIVAGTSLRLGDRVWWIDDGVRREGRVVALTGSGLARVELSGGGLVSLPADPHESGRRYFRLMG